MTQIRAQPLVFPNKKNHISSIMNKLGVIALITALLAMLAAALWFAYGLWTSLETEALPAELWVALAGGVVFSIVVGSGLMALVFYSHRYGYDDKAGEHHGRE